MALQEGYQNSSETERGQIARLKGGEYSHVQPSEASQFFEDTGTQEPFGATIPGFVKDGVRVHQPASSKQAGSGEAK